jgi:hypothetical protein
LQIRMLESWAFRIFLADPTGSSAIALSFGVSPWTSTAVEK